MVDLIDLTNAFVTVLQRVPKLVGDLDLSSPDSIIGYVDSNPRRNSVSAAIYEQKPGTVLIVWQDTQLTQGEIEGWIHHVQFYVRAQRDQSALTLIGDIVNGVPDPGDGLRWRYCPVMSGLNPTTVIEIARLIDGEGIDYYAITTETRETGDA